MIKAEEIDWGKVGESLPPVERQGLQCGDIPEMNYYLLKATAKCRNGSMRGLMSSLVNAQVVRHRDRWLEEISFYAGQKGISIEEAIIELATS